MSYLLTYYIGNPDEQTFKIFPTEGTLASYVKINNADFQREDCKASVYKLDKPICLKAMLESYDFTKKEYLSEVEFKGFKIRVNDIIHYREDTSHTKVVRNSFYGKVMEIIKMYDGVLFTIKDIADNYCKMAVEDAPARTMRVSAIYGICDKHYFDIQMKKEYDYMVKETDSLRDDIEAFEDEYNRMTALYTHLKSKVENNDITPKGDER